MATLLRIAITGCGEVTRAKHLPALQRVPGVALTAVCDINPDRGRAVAARFGIPGCYTDIAQMLSGSAIDAVGVCVPPEAHTEVALAALRAGKHVWVDKPLALTVDECTRIIREAEKTRLTAMTGFHMRFHRLVSQAREVIRGECLGKLESARVVWHSPRGDESIPEWKTRRRTGGGALVEIAVHQFDLLRMLLDSEIEEVFAWHRDGVREDECAVISARMANGVLVSGEFSERTAHEIEIVVSGSRRTLRLDCLRFDGLEVRATGEPPGSPKLRLRAAARLLRALPAGVTALRRGGDYRISYQRAWSHFVDAARGLAPVESTLADGLRAVEAVGAALESTAKRAPVRVCRQPQEATAGPGQFGGAPDPLLSVIVPTYNRPHQLPGLLDALAAQDLPRACFEVILVDDGGSKPLDSLVAGYSNRLRVRLLTQNNGGCASARQSGVDAARGTFLVFTDDDCRPEPDWLTRLRQALLSHPGSAVCGPTVNALTGNVFSEVSQTVVNFLVAWNCDARGFLHFAPTCNLAFPAAEFRAMGGLQRGWRVAGGEDRELCRRWLRAGFSLFLETRAGVSHRHHLTGATFLKQHFNYGRGAYRFHRGWSPSAPATSSLESPLFYLRLLISPLRNNQGWKAFRLCCLVFTAQLATASGFLAEMWTLMAVPGLPRLKSLEQPGKP